MEMQQEIKAKFEAKTPGIKVLADQDLTLLGAPILGSGSDKVMRNKLEDLKLMGERLTSVEAHEALFLLRHCFSIPKLTYFIRTAPFFKHQDILTEYDEQLKISLQTILKPA